MMIDPISDSSTTETFDESLIPLEEVSSIVKNDMVAHALFHKLQQLQLNSVEKKLGQGAVGSVFQLRGTPLYGSHKLALKVMQFSPENIIAKSGEALALNLPDNKLLASALSVLTYDGQSVHCLEKIDQDLHGSHVLIGVVSKAINGSTLKSKLNQGQFSREAVCGYGKKLAEAIHTLHSNGLVHKDLHTENILLENSIDPYALNLIDFGQARQSTPKTLKSDWKHFADLLLEVSHDHLLLDPHFYDLLFSEKHGLLQGVKPYREEEVINHPFFSRNFSTF